MSVYKTSIHVLARDGPCSSLLKKLEEQPKELKQVDELGLTPLHSAALAGQTELFQQIINFAHEKYKNDSPIEKYNTEDNKARINRKIEDLLDHKTKSGCNILHSAVLSGNINMVKFLFENKKTRNKMEQFLFERQNRGKIPAHCAVKNGNLDIFEYLYFKDPSEHNQLCRTSRGETYIVLAARSGNIKLVEYLFDQKIYFPNSILPNILFKKALKGGSLQILRWIENKKEEILKFVDGSSNYLPIHIFSAIESGNLDVVKFLLKSNLGADYYLNTSIKLKRSSPKIDISPISYAAYLGHAKIVQYFCENYSKLCFSIEYYQKAGEGTNNTLPIWFAATRSEFIFKYIFQKCTLEQKCSTFDVKINDKIHHCDLFYFAIAFCDNSKIFDYLKQQTLKLQINNINCIEIACRENNLPVLQKIITQCGDIKLTRQQIQKNFINAAKRKHFDILNYLLDKFDGYLDDFNFPLKDVVHWCQNEEFIERLLLLLDDKKDSQTKIQNEALKIALEFGKSIPAKILLERNNYDIISHDNILLFHYAAKGGSIECLKAVIQKLGPNTIEKLKNKFIKDNKFHPCLVTPLHLAVYFQHYDAVSFLLNSLHVDVNACIPGFATPLHFACSPFKNSKIKDDIILPPNIKIINILLDHGAWESIEKRADFVLDTYGYDVTPYDCATSELVRNELEKRCPRTLAKQYLIPLHEYNEMKSKYQNEISSISPE